jgi:Holliday junction DNA helicase RuvA
MISRLNGRLIEKNPTDLLIECSGVGYEVKISLNTFSVLSDQEAVVLHTKLIIREDAHTLYGFATKEEREMFTHLISVSGIGPNTAIIMLSSMSPDEIAQAILTEDVARIQKVKGIGLKTAQRVIIDLKGKVSKMELGTENIFSSNNRNRFDALNALVSLGFDKKSAEKVLDKTDTGTQTVEELIKEALRLL